MAAILPSGEDVKLRRQMAANPDTSVRILSDLANDEDIWVRSCVARNPNTPQEIKDQLVFEGKIAQYVIEFMRDCDYLYNRSHEWEDFVCEDFDQHVVLTGNDRMYEVEEASWWKQANHVIESFNDTDNLEDFIQDFNRYFGGVPEEKLREIYQEAEAYGGYGDDIEFLVKIANIIHPELNLQQATLRGNNQSDWQDAVYDANFVDPNTLEDFYMGNVMEMRLYKLDPEDFEDYEDVNDIDLFDILTGKDCIDCPTITDTEYFDLYRRGFDKSLAEYFNIPEGSFEVLDN